MKDREQATYRFEYNELGIGPLLLERLMGYTDAGSCPEPVSEAIREIMKQAPDLCDVRGGYMISENIVVDREKKQVFSHGHWFSTKKIVTHQLRRSEHAAWFLCTAGEGISGWARKQMGEGDMIAGYAADILANAVVEEAMDRIQEELRVSAEEQGLKITNRYSPGYCDWDIAEQQKLFDFFNGEFLGITISPSSLMHPMKSVSGIIGIGKEVRYNAYTCNLCSEKDCIYRRIRDAAQEGSETYPGF